MREFLQVVFPFSIAGVGMVCAGVVLDIVQHWKLFKEVPEIFILVPALLGLKGNLEMTLASRLSTLVSWLDVVFRSSVFLCNLFSFQAATVKISHFRLIWVILTVRLSDERWFYRIWL